MAQSSMEKGILRNQDTINRKGPSKEVQGKTSLLERDQKWMEEEIGNYNSHHFRNRINL